MKLSTKGRYGLKAVLDLAEFGREDAVSLSMVAERQEISISYLEQLIAKLKRAGIVNSVRGAQGGYFLAKKPEDISVGDVLRALEGDLNPVDCPAIAETSTPCQGIDLCVTKYVWKKISDSINHTVDTMMLSELLNESDKLKLVHGITTEHKKKKNLCGQ